MDLPDLYEEGELYIIKYPTEPTEGQKVTVTANVTAGKWNLELEGNGKKETIYYIL